MASADRASLTHELSEPAGTRGRLRRVAEMGALWMGFGVLLGCLTNPAHQGSVGFIVAVLAGVIILTPVGALLGLLTTDWKASLVAGVFGMSVGSGANALGLMNGVSNPAALGLLMGGLAGATLIPVYYRLPRRVLAALRARVGLGLVPDPTPAVVPVSSERVAKASRWDR